LRALPAENALEFLGRILQSGVAQQTVAAVDWKVFKAIYGLKRRRFLFDAIGDGTEAPSRQEMRQGSELLKRLGDAPVLQRREILFAHVRTAVARILGFAQPEMVEPRQGFFKMGMDSILTVQLRNSLESALCRSLPSTVAFEYPTVDALTDYLVRMLAPVGHATDPPAAPPLPAQSTAGRISRDDLSEDDLSALLAEKLRKKP
jgi:myxalamid-type polyketide synthase MxaE and MxaD